MKTWIKLYTEILDDPDQGTLTWAQRGIWSALLAMAGKLDHRNDGHETGRLDTPERVAWHLRCSLDELTDALAAFAERGMVDERDGILYLTNYARRQARPPSAQPEAVAERQRRYRERQTIEADNSNEDATISDDESNEGVTTLHRERNDSVTSLDTDTDTDPEGEGDSAAETAANSRPPPKSSKKRAKDTVPEAVHVFRQAAHRYPPKSWYADVDQIVGDSPDDLQFWEQCVKAWVGLGWNPTNVSGMLEFYQRRELPEVKPRESQSGTDRVSRSLDAIRRVTGVDVRINHEP